MAHEPAVDIGEFFPELSPPYVSNVSKVYGSTIDVGDFSPEHGVSYVGYGAKVYSTALIVDVQEPQDFGIGYISFPDKVYNNGISVYAQALPWIPGDDSQEILIGAFCQFSYIVTERMPFTVQFTDETFGEVVSWRWTFGDGTFSIAQHPAHIYSPGTYLVRLDVLFESGCPGFATKTIISPNFILDFTREPAGNVEVGENIIFTPSITLG